LQRKKRRLEIWRSSKVALTLTTQRIRMLGRRILLQKLRQRESSRRHLKRWIKAQLLRCNLRRMQMGLLNPRACQDLKEDTATALSTQIMTVRDAALVEVSAACASL
jgi:hypothetical protein